jgi:hypothetical protein
MAQSWFPVVDRAALLDEGQEQSAADDALRLYLMGIPTQVVTESTGFDQQQANMRAGELRVANGVESAAGRDDGLLFYLSVDPREHSRITLALSIGSRTLPRGGLTRGDLDTIRETIVDPQLASGHHARATVYAMREMLYQIEFTPPPAAPLSDWQARLRGPAQLVVPLLALLTTGSLIWRHRAGGHWIDVMVGGVVAMVLAALSVSVRSGLGIACAVLLGTAVVVVAIARDGTGRRHREDRLLTVTPRPPGSFGGATE